MSLNVGPNGGVFIMRDGVEYALEISPGFACPLARFVKREGATAYTNMLGRGPASIRTARQEKAEAAGLTKPQLIAAPPGRIVMIAKEFTGTKFERLFEAADNAEKEANFSPKMAELISNLNKCPFAKGVRGLV